MRNHYTYIIELANYGDGYGYEVYSGRGSDLVLICDGWAEGGRGRVLAAAGDHARSLLAESERDDV